MIWPLANSSSASLLRRPSRSPPPPCRTLPRVATFSVDWTVALPRSGSAGVGEPGRPFTVVAGEAMLVLPMPSRRRCAAVGQRPADRQAAAPPPSLNGELQPAAAGDAQSPPLVS